jgi:hypothetical protein
MNQLMGDACAVIAKVAIFLLESLPYSTTRAALRGERDDYQPQE